ncbi:hypothetical protein B0H14DRAFT_2650740 [Mycena olivaceomarginata]|nr:hypothetical protein B0H14DRAFT_2650740 [Mycena olivaceomarginata]
MGRDLVHTVNRVPLQPGSRMTAGGCQCRKSDRKPHHRSMLRWYSGDIRAAIPHEMPRRAHDQALKYVQGPVVDGRPNNITHPIPQSRFFNYFYLGIAKCFSPHPAGSKWHTCRSRRLPPCGTTERTRGGSLEHISNAHYVSTREADIITQEHRSHSVNPSRFQLIPLSTTRVEGRVERDAIWDGCCENREDP